MLYPVQRIQLYVIALSTFAWTIALKLLYTNYESAHLRCVLVLVYRGLAITAYKWIY